MTTERSELDGGEATPRPSSEDGSPISATMPALPAPGLSATLRHDLLNPVNQIIGYTEMLEEDVEAHGYVGVAPDLARIRTAAKRLQELIDLASGRSPERGTPSPLAASAKAVPDEPASDAHTTGAAILAHHPLLVVDDDEFNRDVLAKRLEKQGYSVLLAENGALALETMKRHVLDLVLLDVMMPELDGYGVLQHMKSDPHLRELPVIMVSGLSEIDSVVRCIELGAEDYLPKPINPVLLRARIGACLEKKHLRDQERLYYTALKETQDRLAKELSEAAAYVQSLFPVPVTGDVSADWRFIPSTQLGGDAFGYHWLDADHFAMYLLDVCGHGVGAALLSVSVINVLRSQALPDTDFKSPAAVLGGLNNAFQMETQNDQYFTIWYGVYDRTTREIVYASGGHPPAVLMSGGTASGELTPLAVSSLIIGAFPGVTYQEGRRQIVPPATLCVFSDGLYEVARADGSMLDFTNFLDILRPPAGETELRLDRIVRDIQQFAGSETFEDDCSLLAISFQR